jgi:dTDP-4-amino-4,6-dideoxygalactose transaminase
MEAVKREAPAPEVVASRPAWKYVPALPTLWPGMLFSRARAVPPFPFEAPGVSFFYFGRAAVWTLARVLRLDGAEVLAPAYHHGVEIEALLDAGASVRFFRVGPRMQVDPDDIARQIGPRTRAVYFIHYLGFPGPAAALRALCDAKGLLLVEDCALALLSRDGERPLGTSGDAAIFSLYKTLPLPNGGALVLNGSRPRGLPAAPEPPLASTLSHLAAALLSNLQFRGGAFGRALRSGLRGLGRGAVAAMGLSRVPTGTQHFDRAHAELGMSALASRIALAQDFSAIVERRRRNFFLLLGHLRELAPPLFSQLPPGVCPLFFPLRVAGDKAKVAEMLGSRGIETVDFWRHGHPTCPPGEFPDAEALRRGVLEIPIHQDLSPQAMVGLARAVCEVVRGSP